MKNFLNSLSAWYAYIALFTPPLLLARDLEENMLAGVFFITFIGLGIRFLLMLNDKEKEFLNNK